MRYVALATDYDGIIAHNGEVDEPTLATLERLRGTSRRLVLVTGRELDDLIRCMPRRDLFDTVTGGFTTPELQVADDDLAAGRVVEAISQSPYAASTLVFVVEDDSRDGPDYIDAHRGTTFAAGRHVKQGAVVSTRYNTVRVLWTIEDMLRIDHLSVNDAYQRPMIDVFDLNQSSWSFNPVASPLPRTTQVAIPGAATLFAEGPAMKPTHDAAYQNHVTRGFDFTSEDRAPADLSNQIL